MSKDGRIPVGTATLLGLSGGAAAFAGAVAAFVAGDHSQQTLGVIAGGVLAAVLWLATMIGRYRQAPKLSAAPAVNGGSIFFTGSGSGSNVSAPTGTGSAVWTGPADDPSDAEEFSNVPRVESGVVPEAPEGEVTEQDPLPPLEPGDYEEG